MTDTKEDKRSISLLPIRALTDFKLTNGAFRILALLSSYCDKDGVTWVSQKRLSEDMNISRPAITRQIIELRSLGYVVIMKKGFRAVSSNKLRVIFNLESTELNNEITREDVDVQSKEMVMGMIAKAFNSKPNKAKFTPSTGDTPTVKAMKEYIKRKQNLDR